jgi:hypothetical protein
MLFNQTSAPTGWTKVTNQNDKALRVISGTVGTGGSVAFTTAMASQAVAGSIANTTSGGTVANHTLTVAQMPQHRHVGGAHSAYGSNGAATNTNSHSGHNASGGHGWYSSYQGSSSAHNHGFTGAAHNHSFSGTAINLAVAYVDVIIATKD